MQPEPDKIISEARARIIWGESRLSVRDFLTSNGVSDAVAEAKINEFDLERNHELRKIGLRNILTGVVLTSAAGITIYLWLPSLGGVNFGVGMVGMAGIYGLWKLVKGFIYLVRPQSEHKSIPDISNSDILE